MSFSTGGVYYIWGTFDGKFFSKPIRTKFKSFNDIIKRLSKLEVINEKKLIDFDDSFIRNGYFSKKYQEIKFS
jgi:hypothetical protein